MCLCWEFKSNIGPIQSQFHFINLQFVTTEFAIDTFRLDTLCFDDETNSFVIVEYKKGSSYSVIDQGYSYLSVMLNNKADFILEYNEKQDRTLKRDEVDWSSSRVLFVSPAFNSFQKNLDKQISELDKLESKQLSIIEKQEQRAQEGLSNNLAFEESALAELEQKKIKAQKKQKIGRAHVWTPVTS